MSFNCFWSLWPAESLIEIQFDSANGFPVRALIAEGK